MICPNCNSSSSKTIDSRKRPQYTRRRKLCLSCNTRWSTLELPRDYIKFLHASVGETQDELQKIRKDLAAKLLDHGFSEKNRGGPENLEKAREVLRQKRENAKQRKEP